MAQKLYTAPDAVPAAMDSEFGFLVTSGWDQYHEGGGGRYGDDDINNIDYPY